MHISTYLYCIYVLYILNASAAKTPRQKILKFCKSAIIVPNVYSVFSIQYFFVWRFCHGKDKSDQGKLIIGVRSAILFI